MDIGLVVGVGVSVGAKVRVGVGAGVGVGVGVGVMVGVGVGMEVGNGDGIGIGIVISRATWTDVSVGTSAEGSGPGEQERRNTREMDSSTESLTAKVEPPCSKGCVHLDEVSATRREQQGGIRTPLAVLTRLRTKPIGYRYLVKVVLSYHKEEPESRGLTNG